MNQILDQEDKPRKNTYSKLTLLTTLIGLFLLFLMIDSIPIIANPRGEWPAPNPFYLIFSILIIPCSLFFNFKSILHNEPWKLLKIIAFVLNILLILIIGYVLYLKLIFK